MWIVDESKMADELGSFPLPLEVIPYGSTQLLKRLEEKGYHPQFRIRDGKKKLKLIQIMISSIYIYNGLKIQEA